MPDRRSRYFQINLVLAILMAVFILQSLLSIVVQGKVFEPDRFLSFAVYPAFFLVFFFLMWLPDTTTTRSVQVISLVAFGTLVTLLVTPKEIGGDIVFVLAAAMAYKHGLLKRHLLLKTVLLFTILVATRLYLVFFTDRLEFRRVIGQLAIALSFIPILYWIFEDELRRTTREKHQLERRTKQNMPFVEFGRNVSGIVHDFKNDLGLFSMFGRLLEMNRGVPVTDAQIEAYTGYLNRFEERIRRILMVTHLSRNEGVQELPLRPLLESVLYAFQTNLDFRRTVNFSVDLSGADLTVRTDPFELVTIVENVVRNSCEALVERYGSTDDAISGAFLSISATADTGTITVIIGDNGPGIPQCSRCSRRNCIHCSFFEIGKSTKPGGTGIGLINVRDAAARIGGDVIISSVAGEGVTTKIVIPREAPVDG
ncbi:MAG: sensor histidine kinase [Alkalispirochaeta sp.]